MVSGTRFLDEALQHLHEFRTDGLKFMEVMHCQFLQKLLAVMSELYQNLPAIVACAQAA
jgi:hypothetical protein